MGDLVGEVTGDVLRSVIGAHGDAARDISLDATEACADRLADWLECGEATAIGGDIMADDLGVEVIERGEDPDTSVRTVCTMLASVPQSRSGAVVKIVPSWSLAGRGGCRLGESSWFSCISRSTRLRPTTSPRP